MIRELLTGLIFADEFVATVVSDALHANQTDASDAKVAHQLFCMHLTKIGVLHHLVVLARILQRQVIFGQLLCLEGLLQACLAQRAKCESLLLNFDKAHLAESVTTIQVARHTLISVKVLVARRALHPESKLN